MSKPSLSCQWLRQLLHWLSIVLSLVTGLFFLWFGGTLLLLGGSPYYAIAGLAYLSLSGLLLRTKTSAVYVSSLIFVMTWAWSFYEVGLGFWALFPRVFFQSVLFLLISLAVAADTSDRQSRLWGRVGIASALLVATMFGLAFFPHEVVHNAAAPALHPVESDTPSMEEPNWSQYGRTADGTRFAPFTQITPQNVGRLQIAWIYHTGRRLTESGQRDAGVDENTPLQIGNTLYACTPENVVHALDADTGRLRWKFDPVASATEHVSCRGLGYYNPLSGRTPDGSGLGRCQTRIFVGTVDARLIALDAATGVPCPDFGRSGVVDLKVDMGDTGNGILYHPTGAPLVYGHTVLIGGWVRDIQADTPSGVVRAFDARDGSLLWAWDAGKTGIPGQQGFAYERGSPNVWAMPTYDAELSQVYLPTGNAPPDYYGGQRSQRNDDYDDAVVAVDANTGVEKWRFQTVHHDLWDYDLPSQPTLYHLPDAKGQSVPVLIQTTKTGQIFVLDRRTGYPFRRVQEMRVESVQAAEGDHALPTQPISIDMPQVGTNKLTERDMWGMTVFDQLLCRINFRSVRYFGMFTPPSEERYLVWPGFFGGMNWGGVAIDKRSDVLFVNDIRVPIEMSLVRRAEAKRYALSPGETPGFLGSVRPQDGGPFGAIKISYFQSPLGIPCVRPPLGTLSAIDLKSGKLVWQVPMGTTRDTGPLNIKTRLPLPVGMPTLGGPTSTASGIVFFAGTQDYYLRALDSSTGEEIWKERLPVGVVSAPLVFESPATGKQYVVVSAGGTSHSMDKGDLIIAYALPGDSQHQ